MAYYSKRLESISSPLTSLWISHSFKLSKKECWKYWHVRGHQWQDKEKFHNKELHNLYYSTIIIISVKLRSQDSIDSIVSMLQTGSHRNFSSLPIKRQVEFSKATRPALGPTQPLIQGAQGPLSQGLKWPEHQADNSSPFSTKFKNKWN